MTSIRRNIGLFIGFSLWPHIPQLVVPLKTPWIVLIVFYSEAFFFLHGDNINLCGHKFEFAPIDSNLWPYIPQFVVPLKAPWIILIVFYSDACICFLHCDNNILLI